MSEHLVGDMRALPLENCSQAVYFGLYDFSGSTGGLVVIHSSLPGLVPGEPTCCVM